MELCLDTERRMVLWTLTRGWYQEGMILPRRMVDGVEGGFGDGGEER